MELKRAAEGLTLVGVGVILLANMLGYLPWSVWWNILSLWPLLLISAGIDIIGKGTDNSWLRVLASLLVLGGMAYGVFAMPADGTWERLPFVVSINEPDASPFAFNEPHDSSVRSGTAVVKGGVGELSVKAGRDLASAEGVSPYTPRFEADVSGHEADVAVSMGGGSWAGVPARKDLRLDVTLDRRVPWDLTLDAGVSSIDADLSGLDLTSLDVQTGVSQGAITLGAPHGTGGVPVSIETGVSSVTVRFKEGENVRLTVNRGLSSVDTGRGMSEVGREGDKRVYESDGFSESTFWDVQLDAGVSNVEIEFY